MIKLSFRVDFILENGHMEGRLAHGGHGPYGVRAQMREWNNINRIISGGTKVLENGMIPSASGEPTLRLISAQAHVT